MSIDEERRRVAIEVAVTVPYTSAEVYGALETLEARGMRRDRAIEAIRVLGPGLCRHVAEVMASGGNARQVGA